MSLVYKTKPESRVSAPNRGKLNILGTSTQNGIHPVVESESISSPFEINVDLPFLTFFMSVLPILESKVSLNIIIKDGVGSLSNWTCSVGNGRFVTPTVSYDETTKTYKATVEWDNNLFSSIFYPDARDGTYIVAYSDAVLWVGQQDESGFGGETTALLSSDELIENAIISPIHIENTSSYPLLQIKVSTDSLGCNLGEILMLLWSNIQYLPKYPKCITPDDVCNSSFQYPLDLVGYNDGLTLPSPQPQAYIQVPDFRSVLRSDDYPCIFPTVLAQVKYLNEKYPSGYSTPNFYVNILSYASARYMFMGLLNGKFSLKWLRRSYSSKFISQMENSEFSKFLPYFLQPQYNGIDTYFVC